jgi:hypothetical protein
MSAPATPRFPTPGDLARRTPAPSTAARPTPHAPEPRTEPASPATAADLIAPGRLRQDELFRQMFQQGIRLSRMHPEARLVALTLLTYANFRTGLLNKYQPEARELASSTGLTEGQALVQIEVLTQRGWLTHRAPTRGPRQEQQVLQLCIPDLVLQQLRRRRAAQT